MREVKNDNYFYFIYNINNSLSIMSMINDLIIYNNKITVIKCNLKKHNLIFRLKFNMINYISIL